MRTLTIILVVLFSLTLNIYGQDNQPKPSDPLTTTVIISARYGEDYQVTGHTYKQYAQLKEAIKTVNQLKENKHKFGIDAYNAHFSTVMSGLKAAGLDVKKDI